MVTFSLWSEEKVLIESEGLRTFSDDLLGDIISAPSYACPKRTKLRTMKYQVHFSNIRSVFLDIKSILQISSPFYKYQVHCTNTKSILQIPSPFYKYQDKSVAGFQFI